MHAARVAPAWCTITGCGAGTASATPGAVSAATCASAFALAGAMRVRPHPSRPDAHLRSAPARTKPYVWAVSAGPQPAPWAPTASPAPAPAPVRPLCPSSRLWADPARACARAISCPRARALPPQALLCPRSPPAARFPSVPCQLVPEPGRPVVVHGMPGRLLHQFCAGQHVLDGLRWYAGPVGHSPCRSLRAPAAAAVTAVPAHSPSIRARACTSSHSVLGQHVLDGKLCQLP